MNWKYLDTRRRHPDRRAVTPVIAIVLLVAVAVVVSTTVVGFVLVVGDSLTESPPSAAVEAEETDEGTVELRHTAGETIAGENVEIKGGAPRGEIPERIAAGTTIDVAPTSDEVRMVWHPEDSEQTALLDSVSTSLYPLAATGVSQRWKIDTYEDRSRWHALDEADGTLYAGSTEEQVVAIDAADGSKRWESSQFRVTQDVQTVQESNGVVYGGTMHPELWDWSPPLIFALDASDGSQRWKVELDPDGFDDVNSIIKSGDVVYGGGENGVLIALDAADGSERWRYKPADGSAIVTLSENAGTLYLQHESGTITAIDPTDRTELWSKKHLPRSYLIGNGIPVRDGVVYTAGHEGYVAAIDADDGSRIWRKQLDATNVYSIDVDAGVVYTGDTSGNVTAMDGSDGSELWSHSLNDRYVRSIEASKNIVYSGDDQGAYRGAIVAAQLVFDED